VLWKDGPSALTAAPQELAPGSLPLVEPAPRRAQRSSQLVSIGAAAPLIPQISISREKESSVNFLQLFSPIGENKCKKIFANFPALIKPESRANIDFIGFL
jgi:hypothetical protein